MVTEFNPNENLFVSTGVEESLGFELDQPAPGTTGPFLEEDLFVFDQPDPALTGPPLPEGFAFSPSAPDLTGSLSPNAFTFDQPAPELTGPFQPTNLFSSFLGGTGSAVSSGLGAVGSLFESGKDVPLFGGLFGSIASIFSPSGEEGTASEEKLLIDTIAGDVEGATNADKLMAVRKLNQLDAAKKHNNSSTLQATFALTAMGWLYQERQNKKNQEFQMRQYKRQLADAREVQGEQFAQQLQLLELGQANALEQIEARDRGGGAVTRAAFTDFTG